MTSGEVWKRLGMPTCARCDRAVEMVQTLDDGLADRFTIIVRCHGETEQVTLTRAELASADNMLFTRAFAGYGTTPRLPR